MIGDEQYEKRNARGERLLLDTFLWWTQWFQPKPAQLAPFITGANNQGCCSRNSGEGL